MSVNDNHDKIWVSELNARPEIRGAFAQRGPVRFYDTTLRDGEQTVGVVLSPQQKLAIARQLNALGVARIEGGFPRVAADDAEAIELMLAAGLRAEIWGFSRAVKADLDELQRLGVRASIVEAPTSDIKLRAYGVTRDVILKRIEEALAHARANSITVAFFAVDGTRTDLAFLRKVYETALAAGAAEIVVVDTIGACGPEAIEALVREVRSWIGPDVPLHFHGHNDFGLATASAIAAVRGGAQWIQGTINGMGERAGNADIGEIATALHCVYGVPVEMDLGKLREVSRLVARESGYTLDAWKPVVGENLFLRESGAVASQFKIPEAIEPFSAELVGARRAIVLGKKSGLDSIVLKCEELGLTVPEEKRAAVLAAVKQRGIAKRALVTDDEFRAIVAKMCAGRRS
jgi:isopropylmalate/homocitrate/citramalate synthase